MKKSKRNKILPSWNCSGFSYALDLVVPTAPSELLSPTQRIPHIFHVTVSMISSAWCTVTSTTVTIHSVSKFTYEW